MKSYKDPSNAEKHRLLLLIIIMSLIVTVAVGVAMAQFYSAAYKTQSSSLTDLVRTQAHLIDSIAKFDREHSKDAHPQGWKYATLSQVVESYLDHEHLGGTGEITIGRQEGSRIAFLVRSRHDTPTRLQYVPFDSTLAEPMRQALLGESGTVVGSDYRGVEVLAAHEPLVELGWGIVAKVAITEINEPFIRVGIISVIIASVLILGGALMFHRVFDPIINNLEAIVQERTISLKKEISVRKEAEKTLKEEMSYAKLRRQLAAAANKADNAAAALKASIELLCTHAKWSIGHAFLVASNKENKIESADTWYLKHGEQDGAYQDAVNNFFLEGGEGPTKMLLAKDRVFIIADVAETTNYVWSELLTDLGVRSALVHPIKVNGETVAILEFFSEQQIKPNKLLLQTLEYAVDQLGRVFEREITEAKITHLATHDALTGLPGLSLGKDRLSQAMSQARRNKAKAGLIFMDLDGFKLVNDTHGHAAGDEVLKELGARLTSVVRDVDTVARVGGDEFIVVLTGLDNHRGAEIVANKILKVLSSPIDYGGVKLHLGVSMGISIFPDNASDSAQLIKVADKAMYDVKTGNKNGFKFSEEQSTDQK